MTSKTLTKLLGSMGKKGTDSEKVAELFLKYCKRKHILYKVPAVIKRLEELAVLRRKESLVFIRSPHHLSEPTVHKIQKFVGAGESTKTELVIDPSLVGGFIAEYGNRVYDGSMRRQLERLEETLAQE